MSEEYRSTSANRGGSGSPVNRSGSSSPNRSGSGSSADRSGSPVNRSGSGRPVSQSRSSAGHSGPAGRGGAGAPGRSGNGGSANRGGVPNRGGNRRRPQRRQEDGLLSSISGVLLYVMFVIGLSALLATLGWLWAGDVLALNKMPNTATITLPESIFTTHQVDVTSTDKNGVETVTQKTVKIADMDYVADVLKENGLIEYKFLFKLFAKITGADDELSAGSYELNTDMDYRALLLNLGRSSVSRTVIEVTIPEGYTADQIFALLDRKGVCTVAELEEMAATYDYKFTWLKGVIPLGDYHRLEGYLFPDTYNFYAGDDPKYVINKMLANFERKMEKYFDAIAEGKYTLAELVAIASLIEKETDGSDQSTIASVIYNRLTSNAGETNGYLQMDATLVYINGGNVPTEADKSIDSPYNTYLYPGLPEGPIANPGMAALYAAMNPENTKYFFYVLGDDSVHHFYQTYQGMLNFMATQSRYQG